MTLTEARKAGTDIETLVARGKSTFEGVPQDGLAWELADAIERQQAVVEAAQHAVNGYWWKKEFVAGAMLRLKQALAALDAPPEGDG